MEGRLDEEEPITFTSSWSRFWDGSRQLDLPAGAAGGRSEASSQFGFPFPGTS